jgi:hypothetical protein
MEDALRDKRIAGYYSFNLMYLIKRSAFSLHKAWS